MTRLFRSKSCGFKETSLPSPSLYPANENFDDDDDEEYEFEDDEEGEEEEDFELYSNPISTPFIGQASKEVGNRRQTPRRHHHHHQQQQHNQFPILTLLVAALRKSLVTCSVERDDVVSMDISWPTEVRHVSHVTFDRYNGFLGLPVEFEPELPPRVPSASASVFGVSAKSMQCSYDRRGNSVPTILLMMQKRLYSGGGLQAEGIFRINAENSQEEYLRGQLNRGIVPHGIDVHCLAGLIKAWFRELPTGVLDSLTPEQVMHCNSEEECVQLVKLLPSMEAALLDWAVNLMADVVQHAQQNKMNARNIAMVFAPNMTQMADPLTALIHAVQVMNLLKTLILKTQREREESAAKSGLLSPLVESPDHKGAPYSLNSNNVTYEQAAAGMFLRSAALDRLESDSLEKCWNLDKSDAEDEFQSISGSCSPVKREMGPVEDRCSSEYNNGEVEGILDRLSLRKGVRRLCRHPVFQLSKPVKKSEGLGIVNTREGGGEAYA
ncbi:Rho GTPase-activating protein domain [Dillenia turbinata]|uniref:Rho GTPase-activating protein domain n=1 Tax=Dillenia turbinata TaxID=194707 RepID=A0AAN8UYR7_9MAGN